MTFSELEVRGTLRPCTQTVTYSPPQVRVTLQQTSVVDG